MLYPHPPWQIKYLLITVVIWTAEEKSGDCAIDSINPRKSTNQVYPEESNQDSEGPGNHDVWGMVERPDDVLPERENAWNCL